MTYQLKRTAFITAIALLMYSFSDAQFLWNSDSAFKANTPNTGRLWGYAFGDFYYKAHSDSLNRGGNNQYTGIPQSRNAFQFRRIYLGYDYNISKKFATELLLAAEDNFPAFNPPSSATPSGDQTQNNKSTFFIKYANIKWKDLWKGTDLVFGLQGTPAFPFISERIWAYRSIERTIADIRRTPSYDLGLGLRGFFDPSKKNFGYNLLVANGTSAKPASNGFRWFYGDVFAYFAQRKLVVDLYADYQRLNWQPGWHHDRQMIKGYIAYSYPSTDDPWPAVTVGVEGFVNNLRQDVKNVPFKGQGTPDTATTKAQGLSMYIHGNIVKNKLRFFARIDLYNPNKNMSSRSGDSTFVGLASPSGYNSPGYKMTFSPSTGAPTSATSTGDISAKETFFTVGLDFTPYKGVHLMPNVWYNHYKSQLDTPPGVPVGTSDGNYDLVYRLTFYFVFGK
ncbi:MAG: hypothetical protein C5B59_00710 [Bacteroidetes bacterium]|nr:MAG: hypothetical protein C5B59_00710 [Bacteroidota bacterium]